MVELTKSLSHWLWENHRDIIGLIMFGHIELLTDEMCEEYLKWCKTDEEKPYLCADEDESEGAEDEKTNDE